MFIIVVYDDFGKNNRIFYDIPKIPGLPVDTFVFKVIFVLGLGLLILGEIAAINYVFPVDGLRYPIQTVPRFKTCTLSISIGLFLVIRTLIKSALYYVLFLALELALLKKKYRTLIVLSALLGLLEIAVLKGTPFDLLNVVRFEKTLGNSYKGILIFIALTSFILLILIIVFGIFKIIPEMKGR